MFKTRGPSFSPSLYHLWWEFFFSFLCQEKFCGKISGLKVGDLAPSITHLFFADDIIFFLEANFKEFCKIRQLYEKASWQTINNRKSVIAFGKRLFDKLISTLSNLTQVNVIWDYKKYLGGLISSSKNKHEPLNYIKEKIYKTLEMSSILKN